MSRRLSGVSRRLSGASRWLSGVSRRLSGVSQRLSGVSRWLSVSRRLSGVSRRLSGVSRRSLKSFHRFEGHSQFGQVELCRSDSSIRFVQVLTDKCVLPPNKHKIWQGSPPILRWIVTISRRFECRRPAKNSHSPRIFLGFRELVC